MSRRRRAHDLPRLRLCRRDRLLIAGSFGSREPRRAEQAFGAFLRGVGVLEITVRVAKRAAAIRGALRRQRLPMTHRALDILISATAVEHGLVLISRNQRDYADIPGLLLIPSV